MMQTPAGSLISAERMLSTLEERSRLTPRRPETPSPVTVAWWCADPADVRLFLASLASDPVRLLASHPTSPHTGIRRIPLTITGGSSLELTFSFNSDAAKKAAGRRFSALEPLGITWKQATDALLSGAITLGVNHQRPWKLIDPDLALAVITDTVTAERGDLAQHIGTITLSVPSERLDGVTVTMYHPLSGGAPEVAWILAPPRELTATETAAIATLAGQSGSAAMIPFLRVAPGEHTSGANALSDTTSLAAMLDTLTGTVAGLASKTGSRAIPLAGNTSSAQRPDDAYLTSLFAAVWELTVSAGLTRSRWRTSIDLRRDVLADTLMAPPVHVMDILSNHAALKLLADIEPLPAPSPRDGVLDALRDTGISLYGNLLAEIAASLPATGKKPVAEDDTKPAAPKTAPKQVTPESKPVPGPEAIIPETEPIIPKQESTVAPVPAAPPEPVPEPEPEPEPEPVPEPEPEPDDRYLAIADFMIRLTEEHLFEKEKNSLSASAERLKKSAETQPEKLPLDDMAKMDHRIGDATGGLDAREKDIQKDRVKLDKLLSPPKPTVDPDELEALEQIEMFWKDFVPAALRKLTIKKYDDEVRNTIAREKKAFDDYLALTPDIDEGFIECRDTYWPEAAKRLTRKVNELFDDVLDLWQLTVGQQFNTLEEFRSERFPGEPPIDCSTTLKTKRRPAMTEKLGIVVPKKPGIITKILTMKAESSVWREQQIATFSKTGAKFFETYRTDAIAWLKDAYERVRQLLHARLDQAKSAAADAHKRIEALTAPPVVDRAAADRLEADIRQSEKALAKDRAALKQITSDWDKLKQNIAIIDSKSG